MKNSGTGYSGNMFVGSKYNETSHLSISEKAKLIRAELKTAYPKVKFSVTTSKYSGGCSLDVEIKAVDSNPFSPEYNEFLSSNKQLDEWNFSKEKYSAVFLAMKTNLKSIVEQYNFDDSDTQSDYYSVAFYSHIRVDESALIHAFYPNNDSNNLSIQYWAKTSVLDTAKNAKAAEKKKKLTKGFKKGDEVLYRFDSVSKNIPQGIYNATILKVPNGRASLSTIKIRFDVDKCFDMSGNVVNTPKGRLSSYTIELRNADSLMVNRKVKIDKILNG
jgi:hypothetical protein